MSADKQISFTLTQQGGVGAWWARSPQIHDGETLTCGSTIPEALENAAKMIRDLALSFALEVADGRQPKPIFTESASAKE